MVVLQLIQKKDGNFVRYLFSFSENSFFGLTSRHTDSDKMPMQSRHTTALFIFMFVIIVMVSFRKMDS